MEAVNVMHFAAPGAGSGSQRDAKFAHRLSRLRERLAPELERGEAGLYTITTERASGLVSETANFAGIATADAPHN